MAFLASGNQGNVVSGAGGYAGQGGTVGGKQKTTAGSPGGWYNIQEFLAANPQTPAAQTRIQQKGSQQLGEAKQQFQEQVGALPSAPTPEQYSQERLGGIAQGGVSQEEAQNLRGFLDQSYKPTGTPEQLLPGVSSPYQGMQPGNFESIMNWYGNIERPSAAYTPGMQRMDEMLLRGQKGFAEQFPGQMQEQFQTQVAQPMEQKREEVGQQQKAAQQQFSDEGKQWFEGIGGFLGGEKEKISNMYEQQRQELAKQSAMTPEQIMGPERWQQASEFPLYDTMGGMTKPSPDMPDYQRYNIPGIDYSQFLSRGDVMAPTMGTAASSAFTPEQLQAYNALAGLMPEQGYEQYAGSSAYDPGAWSFDEAGFGQEYNRVQRALENQRRQTEQAVVPQVSPDVAYQAALAPQERKEGWQPIASAPGNVIIPNREMLSEQAGFNPYAYK